MEKLIDNGNCCVWDFTSRYDGDIENFDEETEKPRWNKLNLIAKKWCYQIERGTRTGYVHFQVRLSLKTKSRGANAYEKISEIFGAGHLSPTSKTNRDNDFYVMKEDTRIQGPWSEEKIAKSLNIPWDVKEFKMGNTEWMKQTIEWMKQTRNLRKILVWVDPNGSNGKSSFKRWCFFQEELDAMSVPTMNSYEDICQFVMSQKKCRNYIIDMPRAINKERMYQFWSGLESLKEGYAYDKRYSGKQEYFDPPNIIVFTNHRPDLDMLSKDRWVIKTISEEHKQDGPIRSQKYEKIDEEATTF